MHTYECMRMHMVVYIISQLYTARFLLFWNLSAMKQYAYVICYVSLENAPIDVLFAYFVLIFQSLVFAQDLFWQSCL